MRDAAGAQSALVGFLLVDKPVGPSSHAAVQAVRRELGIGGKRGTKGGHAGTLDPFADGLLVVLIGRATRLMPFVVGHDKRYLVGVRFGARSTTDDLTGELTPDASPLPDDEAVVDALRQLRATTAQIPPAVSAIHVDGRRAYARVRAGEVVEMQPRAVRFSAIELVDVRRAAGQLEVILDVRCGSGAYMRALARDLGTHVGCGAYCSSLRRLEVGSWSVESACAIDACARDAIRPAIELIPSMQRYEVDEEERVALATGRRVQVASPHGLSSADPVALTCGGELVAIGELLAGEMLQPRTLLVDVTHGRMR